MTINTIHFEQLRNSEHIQFSKAVKHVFGEHSPETLHVQNQYDAFSAGIEKMETAFVSTQGNVLTKALITEDEKRDSYLIGIIKVVNGYTKHFSDEKVKAAERIKAHIAKYGKRIDTYNYNAETASITDLIDGIETDVELSKAVALSGIADWFAELKASNTEFNRLYESRAEDEATKTKLVLRELRDDSVKQYKELIKYFEAASIMYPSDVYDTLANKLNEFIDKYNNLRRKSKSDEEDVIS